MADDAGIEAEMVTVTEMKSGRLFEPLNATETRRLEWEAHFRKAGDTAYDKPQRNYVNMAAKRVVGNSSAATPREVCGTQSMPRRGEKAGESAGTYRSPSMASGHEYLAIDAGVKHAYSKIVDLYQVNDTFDSQRGGAYRHYPANRQQMLVRLLKMGKHSFRLGIIIYGATQSTVLTLRRFVSALTRDKGRITSGYVNGVNCTSDEEK